ncbi:MAG: acyloxyacyl hydrolase [Syntrophales bacterium]|nr:acyloxyacyl hydrolase [Syntrophales bacterium]
MKTAGSRSMYVVMFLLAFIASLSSTAFGADAAYEITVGAGSSLNEGINSRQVLITPALKWTTNNEPSIQFRLEGNFEAIYYNGKMTVLAGIAPMIRLFLFPYEKGPFIEGGAGLNYISRLSIGHRDLGGSMIFSPMAGAGYGFSWNGKPLILSLRYRHISNAGLYSKNDGFDSLYLMTSIPF